MAKKVKITKGGQTVYPATVMDAVMHPDLRVDASKLIEEVNVSKIYPTGGIDGTNKYTLETAIAKIPSSLRNVGIKCSFLGDAGKPETWEYRGGTFTSAGSWVQTGAKMVSGLSASSGYLTCSTAAATAAKTVAQNNFILSTNCRLIVKMTNYNTAASPTLNVNSTGGKPLYYNGEIASADNTWEAGEVLDMYYDGVNYQASSFQGGGVKAEKIEFDNSNTEIKSDNAQGAIEESYAQGKSNREAIFNVDISQKFRFTDGNYITDLGTLGGSQNLSYCDYVDISSYNYLFISLVSLASNNTIKASIAFYDEDRTFISSYTPDNTPDRTLDVTAVAVPANARYLRTSKWAQPIMDEYQFTFIAKACMNLSALSDEIDGIYDILKKRLI